MRILEIGSGGYNAALPAELVGPSGQVTTVDIDEDITDRASRLLGEAGYSRVNVVLADAEGGVPEYAHDTPHRRGGDKSTESTAAPA